MTRNQIINEIKLNLDRKRHQAQIMADEYVQELCKNEEFKRLYTNYNQLKIDLIKLKYGGSDIQIMETTNSFEKVKQLYDDYISSHMIDIRRMEPQYECSKCNDTGVVGLKMCDCLKLELNRRLSEQNKQYKFATQLFKLGLGFLIAYPRISLTSALIPPVMSKVFGIKKEEENKKEEYKLSKNRLTLNQIKNSKNEIFKITAKPEAKEIILKVYQTNS